TTLHRPGLALAGYVELFTFQRVQIIGNTENQYLDFLSLDDRKKAFSNLVQFPVPCVFLTESNELHPEIIELATKNGVPVFRTPLPSTEFMTVLREFLYDQFAPQISVHASMVDVYGVGLLLMGKSGIGKSEVALDLVERGHRLVADDVVILTKKDEQVLMAAGTELVQHFMEIRGLGLIDVRSMFGIRAIRFQKRAEVVVNMQLWDPDEEYSRLGMVDETLKLLGVDLPSVKLPIMPGKNVTVLCEVIALNHLLKNYGYDPAEVFSERLAERIRTKRKSAHLRGIEYFEHDFE
ncbi:MAG: HPr kinase/phosphorylase, partial [Rhodothermales bacterium]|nr:HPr kinase/phosphorylase [Rhodothermales bacterium]